MKSKKRGSLHKLQDDTVILKPAHQPLLYRDRVVFYKVENEEVTEKGFTKKIDQVPEFMKGSVIIGFTD